MTGRVALVTGGASGIGKAVCAQLAAAGHAVAVLDYDGDAARAVASELAASGAKALGVAADVSDRAAVDAAVEATRDGLGPIGILVTSAGVTAFTPFAEITVEDWRRIIDVNLTGTFHCVQSAIPDMVGAGWGRVVTISSSSAQSGAPKMAHYAASKGGVIVLTKVLAREYAAHGITVNTIPPSSIDTPMVRNAPGAPSAEAMARRVPVGRVGTPDDIASATLWLCSEAASYVTGQVIGVNGGAVI